MHLKSFIGEENWTELQESHELEARQILIGKMKEGAIDLRSIMATCLLFETYFLGSP